MAKPHPHLAALRRYQKWRRGGPGDQPNPTELGQVIDWAIAVCVAAENLVAVKGRHHAEVAYKQLAAAVNPQKGGAT